ncbi:MAG TPA: NAD(P)H-binding protein [Thermoplasmata archaeon]|nr:NAD(P)H-binding protein [Thermoplasmata archaeon]
MTDAPSGGRVLVVGGTGFVGRRLVPVLIRENRSVRVLARRPEAARRLLPPSTEVVPGDLLDPASLGEALEGVEVVYYLVHSMARRDAGEDFAAVDRRAAANLVEAASRSGVRRIIYVGGLGGDAPVRSRHLESRREVGGILAGGRPKLTTFRAAIIVGAGGSSFEMVVQLVEHLPLLLCPSWVRTRCQPIDIRDLVEYLAGCLEVPETIGGSFDVGGPEVLPYYAFLNRIGARLGRLSRIVVLPVLTPRLSAHWVGLITDVPSPVARDLVEGMRTEVVCRENRIRELLPVPLHSLESALDDAFSGRPLRPLWIRRWGALILGTRSAERAVLDVPGRLRHR